MKFFKIFFPAVMISAHIAACSPATPPVPTSQPASEIPVKASPTIPTGVPFSSGNIRLVIPEGLASGAGAITTVDVEYPYINPSWGDMPDHTVITLDGYELPRPARILVFNASEYASYTPETGKTVAALQSLPPDAGQPYPDVLTTTFYSRSAAVNSSSIHGIRYLSQVMDAYVPITNSGLFYYFQGLSSDGAWFIEAIFPVNAPFLASDESQGASVPPGGIEFPYDQLESIEVRNGYYDAVRTLLNAAALADYSPAITMLDELISSISIQP